jgi:hypothetical protein
MLGDDWEDMLLQLPRSATEFKIRAVRDHLADALTTLPSIIEKRNSESLHFYLANLTGLRKALFPELANKYQQWVTDGDWSILDNILIDNPSYWLTMAKRILNAYSQGEHEFDQRVLKIVGI